MSLLRSIIVFGLTFISCVAHGQRYQLNTIAGRVYTAEEVAAAILETPPKKALPPVAPEARAKVIQLIRQRTGDFYEKTQGRAREQYFSLVQLGDLNAGWQVLEAGKKGDQAAISYVSSDAPPGFIVLLAEDFFGKALQDSSMLTALMMLERGEALPAETRKWAEANARNCLFAPHEQVQEMMQAWWRENEAALRAENYAAVKPGKKSLPEIKLTLPERTGESFAGSWPSEGGKKSRRPASREAMPGLDGPPPKDGAGPPPPRAFSKDWWRDGYWLPGWRR